MLNLKEKVTPTYSRGIQHMSITMAAKLNGVLRGTAKDILAENDRNGINVWP